MASTWDKIPHTHRTILFERFTHPKDDSVTNLYDILFAITKKILNSPMKMTLILLN